MPGLSLRGNRIVKDKHNQAIFQANNVRTTSQTDTIPHYSYPLKGAGACGLLSHQPEPPSPQPRQLGARFERQFYFLLFFNSIPLHYYYYYYCYCYHYTLIIIFFNLHFYYLDLVSPLSSTFSGFVDPSSNYCHYSRFIPFHPRPSVITSPGIIAGVIAGAGTSAGAGAVPDHHFQTGIIDIFDQSELGISRASPYTTATVTATTAIPSINIRRLEVVLRLLPSPLAASTALGDSPSSQRLHTQTLHLRTCHRPP